MIVIIGIVFHGRHSDFCSEENLMTVEIVELAYAHLMCMMISLVLEVDGNFG